MLDYLLSLDPIIIVAICVLVPILITVPIVLAVLNQWIRSEPDDANVLSPAVGFIGTAFTLLLAFVIVTVWGDQVTKQDVLFAEITTIENILIEGQVIAPDMTPELKKQALAYLDSVMKLEVDETPPIGGNPETEKVFLEALSLVEDIEKRLEADPLKKAEAQSFFEETREWIQDREMRVNKSAAELDDIFTGILIFLALLTVIAVALLPSATSHWAKWTQTISVAISVGLIMSLVFYIASERFTRTAEDQQILRVEEALK